jgi:high-affinity iron transporter
MDHTFFQAVIMSFREGLEAFLIVVLLLKFLNKTENKHLTGQVWNGAFIGILASVAFGGLLYALSSYLGGLSTTAKIWESVAGFVAVVLITTFIVWMIKNGAHLKAHIEGEASQKLSKTGIFGLTLIMVVREGTEIAIFSFAGDYSMLPIMVGLVLSIILVVLISYSLVKVNLKTIFTISLIYLILQAGYLFGYSIHEGLSAVKNLDWIHADSVLFSKAFNLSDTILNHKKGLIGLPLNVTIGWYSKPEWVQLGVHFMYLFLLFGYWKKVKSDEVSNQE